MHDIKAVREDAAGFDAAMARRGVAPLSSELLGLDDQRREAVAALQVLQSGRNALAKRIGEAKRAKEDTAALEAEGAALRGQMEALEAEVPRLEAVLRETVAAVPNVLDAAVPDGRDETDNKVEKSGARRANWVLRRKEHFEIGEKLGLMDFGAAGNWPGRALPCCAGRWRGWSGHSGSLCWMCIPLSMAIARPWCRCW